MYPTHDSSVGPCCMSCLSPGGPTCPDPLCLYLGLSGPPVSTACLSLSDPGPESPLWKRDTRPREGRMPCVCVCVHTQSCPTRGDLMDYVPPGSSVHGISSQENWSGLPFPSLWDLPGPGIELTSLASPALACRGFTS